KTDLYFYFVFVFHITGPEVIAFLLHKSRNSPSQANKSKTGSTKVLRKQRIPLKSDPALSHLDTLEQEKLAWTMDLPEVAKQPPSVNLANDGSSSEVDTKCPDSQPESTGSTIPAPCQARFDLNGFVIPPEAVLDVHLGLHHHGEEPERAGYTVGELFHLARSSVPAQRRLALAILTSSLAQSRRGRHVPHLAPFYAPSLIYGLLAAPESSQQDVSGSGDSGSGTDRDSGGGGGGGGIAFLLRWCLDEAVSALTSVSTAAAGVSDTGSAAGISLVLLVECVRGFACLLSDSFGEAYLARSFAWSSGLLSNLYWAPPMMSTKRQKSLPGVTVRTPNPDSDTDMDHAKAMRRDPVRFLFNEGQLARRLSWLLADGLGRPRARLSADAVGLWLPALLIRAVRHSTELAYKIFSTPELFATLRDNFLPEAEPHHKHDASCPRPLFLSEAYNLPLPSVLQLHRITMMSSCSIRLAMVNDLHIVERCLSYVFCPDCVRHQTVSSIESLIAHLPLQLPVRIAFQLHLEALRCLTAFLRPSDSNTRDSVPVVALRLIWKHGSALVSSGVRCHIVYRMLCNSGSDFNEGYTRATSPHYLVPLLTAWLAFLVEAFEQIVDKSDLFTQSNSISTAVGPWIDQIGLVCIQVLDYARNVLQGQSEMPTMDDLEPLLRRKNLSFDLLSVAMMCTLRLVSMQHRLDLSAKLIGIVISRVGRDSQLGFKFHFDFIHVRPTRSTDLETVNESVLTGAPATLADVDIITIPVWDVGSNANDQPVAVPVDWESLPTTNPIDVSLIEPVTLASTNLPDLGTAVCFRYRVSERNLGAFWWPKSGVGAVSTSNPTDPSYALDECDPLAIDLVLQTSRVQPIVIAMLKCMQFFLLHWRFHLAHQELVPTVFSTLQPIVKWVTCLATRPLFPWLRAADRKRVPSPHWLVALECQMASGMLLLCGQLLSQQGALADNLRNALFDATSDNLIHQATLRLVPYLRANQLRLLDCLLTQIVFSPEHLKWTHDQCGLSVVAPHLPQIEGLFRREFADWYRRFKDKVTTTSKSKNASDELPTIPESVDESNASTATAVATHSFCRDTFPGITPNLHATIVDSLLPQDWVYLPLVNQYTRSKLQSASSFGPSSAHDQQNVEGLLHDLTNALRWLFFLVHRHHLGGGSGSTGPPKSGLLDQLSHFARLCIGCLAYPGAGALGFGESGFLLAQMISRLELVRRLRDQPIPVRSLEHMDLPEQCASFYDLYADLLDHYAALSYSSPVFANLILWPCQQSCHMKYRRALWGEHQSALVAVRLRCDQLLFPLHSLLEPEETDESVLRGYVAAVWSGVIRVDKHPVLFLIAVHHLNRYLYTNTNADREFTKQFIRLPRITPPSRRAPVAPCGTRVDLLDLIRRYRQPYSVWMNTKPQLLDLQGMQLSSDEALTNLLPTRAGGASGFWDYCQLAGIEYYHENELPEHRRTYWVKHLSPS
ncbi:hypothetical protein D915_006170, partial [Fasciola hepatica]